MKRRSFISGLTAFTAVGLLPNYSYAADCIYLNQRVVNNARALVGRPAGDRYNTWMFGYTVMMNSGGRGPYYGPQNQYAWGRQIGWNEVRPGDYIQFEGPTSFRLQRCGKAYWSCSGRCTLIVLSRTNGKRPGSLIEVAYQYKEHIVRVAKLDAADCTSGANQAYMYRPQLR